MTLKTFVAILLLVVTLCYAPQCKADEAVGDFIWIEGEDAATQTVARPNSWYESVQRDALSGGKWISNFASPEPATATYNFDVIGDGPFMLWVRANPVASQLDYHLDDGQWLSIDFSGELRGRLNLATDNKPDLRFIAWVKVGQVTLPAGRHEITFRFASQNSHHGALDCFVLSRIPFIPSGAAKPTPAKPAGQDDWFPVVMDDDAFSKDSIIDIGHLIDAPAGKRGFLQRDADTLRLGDDAEPIKFWAVNAGLPSHWSAREMGQAARWYRKHGINLVRQHPMTSIVGLLDADGRFEARRLDHYDRWFAAMKEQGIYTTWSVVYPHHGRFLQKHDKIDPALFAELDTADTEADGQREPIAANDFINLDESLQAVAWQYFDTLLNHVNPYTGLAYKDDPALAVVEFQNESNVFFFTLNVLADPGKMPILSKRMRRSFHDFAVSKYKTVSAAQKAWGGVSADGDDWNSGELALMGAHHWGSDGPLYEFAGQTVRAGDYIEFLTEIQRRYYEKREQALREIGFKGVTVATAWKSGGPAASMANLYADTAADMIDRHNYFGGGDGGHRIIEGEVNNQTHLSDPGSGLLSLGMFQIADRPFGVSEAQMMPPNPWKAESVPLLGFYGIGLQGWDAVYGFAMDSYRMGDGWHNQGKYVVETPHGIGQFPAVAFAVHNGHFDEGEVVSARQLSQHDVYSGKDVLGQSLSGGGHDNKSLVGRLTTPPAALAVGRVTIEFGDETSVPKVDLGRFHDVSGKRLAANTGQLIWDYGNRRVLVKSRKTQGVIGFVAAQPIDLPAVDIQCSTPFVSMLMTPLDNADLEQSRHILITAMARDAQTGSEYSGDFSKLIHLGSPPLLMEPVQASIRIHGDAPISVKPCDLYGVPKEGSIPVDASGEFRIDGRYQTYYYEVRR